VVERSIQTVKIECTRRLLVSLRAKTFRQELSWFTVCTINIGRIPPWQAGHPTESTCHSDRRSEVLASSLVASACPLCLASSARQGTVRRADRGGGELPAQPQAFASRHHPASGVSGISCESLTEQLAVSLCRSLCADSLPTYIRAAEPLLLVRRSIEVPCDAWSLGPPLTRDSTAEFPWTSTPLEASHRPSRLPLPLRRAFSGRTALNHGSLESSSGKRTA
jgi:hypothetical protein